jgi:hypothetical protein
MKTKYQTVLTALITIALFIFAVPAYAGDGIRISPPQSHPYGKSYGEWSAEWWKWAYSLPTANHPLFDETGANISAGQSGKVWFLGGTFTAVKEGNQTVGRVTRTATVAEGKALFIPILNVEANNFNVDSLGNQTVPTTNTEHQLRDLAKDNIDAAIDMYATIDGRTVNGLQNVLTTRYRVQSPLFQYTLESGNLYEYFGQNILGQTPLPGAVADGVYLMVEPLSVGKHTIKFGGRIFIPAQSYDFLLDITYNLTVLPNKKCSNEVGGDRIYYGTSLFVNKCEKTR